MVLVVVMVVVVIAVVGGGDGGVVRVVVTVMMVVTLVVTVLVTVMQPLVKAMQALHLSACMSCQQYIGLTQWSILLLYISIGGSIPITDIIFYII